MNITTRLCFNLSQCIRSFNMPDRVMGQARIIRHFVDIRVDRDDTK